VHRRIARKLATAETVNGPPVSPASRARGRKLNQDDHVFQGFAVYGDEPFRCIGHLLSRGRDGYEAYDRDDRALGIFLSLKTAADAVTAAAARGSQ
jgi:hypothetical protein